MSVTVIGDETAPGLRDFVSKPLWACLELVLAAAVIVAGLKVQIGLFIFGSAPWLVAIGSLSLWWRGPGLPGIGLGRPASLQRTIGVGLLVGISYQLVGTFAIEPVITRLTSGELPDVSVFRPLVGDKMQLAHWIAISWSLAAVIEEIAYRGWILTRCAEIWRFSRRSWVGGMLASSVLFGIIHAYQGVSGMIATGLTGLVFAGVYLSTGRNLWASITAHGAMDTTGFVMMYLGVYPGL
jgi:membrane protease YdiL (CAAX protease family)